MTKNPAIAALAELSVDIGLGRHSLQTCRQLVRDNAALIENALAAVFSPSVFKADPRSTFMILDNAKALITRRLYVERRAKAGSHPDVDIIVSTSSSSEIDDYLRRQPQLAVCSMYLALDGQMWAVLARSVPSRSNIEYAFVPVVDKSGSSDFAKKLRVYVRSVVAGEPNGALQSALLDKVSASILPAVARMDISNNLVLVPHRLLHLLPLHCMSLEVDRRRVYLDEMVNSIGYASSLFEMYAPRGVSAKRDERTQGSILAVLDLASSDLGWLEVEHLYYKGLKRMGLPVDVVTTIKQLPNDFSKYLWITWGSHGKSNPTNWGGSYLAFGGRKFSATDIALNWTCSFTPWILLGACESAVDSAELARADEYCGLDLAFRIAGAWGAFATMWPIKDPMAAYADTCLVDLVLFKRKEPAEALVALQRRLRTGTWKEMMYGESSGLSNEMAEVARKLQQLPANAFCSIRDWGVFRCYGVSHQ